MDLSKIDALTIAATARLQLHRNEAETSRDIAAGIQNDKVFTEEVHRVLLQYPPPPATAPSTSSVRAGVQTTLLQSDHGDQFALIPDESTESPMMTVQTDRDPLMGVNGNRYDNKEPNLRVPVASSSGTKHRRNPSFAYKLHAILMDEDCNSAISWLPSGKSFCIMDKEKFTKKVLPKYFREAKFESFARRIKRWGFRRMYTTGVKKIIYSHNLFQKDRVDLCKLMNGRSGQASTEVDSDAAFNPARFENEMEEQIALAERTLQANPESIGAKDVHKKQLQTSEHRPVPISFGNKPVPIRAFHHMCHGHPMVMASCPPQALVASPWGYSMSEFRASYMPCNGMHDLNVVRQMSALERDIAVCEEQLAILQRLKTLKDESRGLMVDGSKF